MAVSTTAQAQTESENSAIVYSGTDICITGWAKINQWGVGHGSPVNLAMTQLHAYTFCPSTPLPEGGGNMGSATTLKVGTDSLRTKLVTYYWDGSQSAWVICHDTGWQYDSNASSAAQSYVVTSCPRSSYTGTRAYLQVKTNGTWKGGSVWSGYYYFN